MAEIPQEISEKIKYLAGDSMLDSVRLEHSYEKNPEVFQEVIQTAEHNSSIVSEGDLTNYIVNECTYDEKDTKLRRVLWKGYQGYAHAYGLILIPALSYLLIFSDNTFMKSLQKSNDLGMTVGIPLGLASLYFSFRSASKKKKLKKEYEELKDQADTVMGVKRIRGNPQLELMLINA